jgi:phage shock protein C
MKNRLYRNTFDGWVGGVCEGLGEYFHIDPTVVRLIAVFGALAGASTVLAYIVLWIVVPEK